MANIKRKIENLKPGKEYLLTVRAKNSDVNVTSDYAETIRFTVPVDSSIPTGILGLELYSGIESVMFVFSFSEDKDISRYEYELYNPDQLEVVDGIYQLKEDQEPLSTGFNDANVFTVTVDNLQIATPYLSETEGLQRFWGRVRGIDTTGNAGDWSDLVETDSRTPLIDNQFIGSLTASKITAGTIGAHTIQLSGSNSIIKSSTFDGVETSTPGYYTDFTNGWLIDGNGNSYFVNTNISGYISGGTIDIGGSDDKSFHVDAEGRMWAGAPSFDHAKFRVDNNGVVRIGEAEGATPSLWIDQTGAITIGSTPNSGDFIVSSTGQISIGGNDSTSFHIKSDGTVLSGDTVESATPPFRLNNDGSIDVGGSDASSMHILSNGNVQVGATKDSVIGSAKTITAATASDSGIVYTSANHGFSVGQTVSITGISSSPANKLNFNNRVIKSVTTNTFTIDNPLILSIIQVTPSNPSVGNARYRTSSPHGFQAGQNVVVTGIVPSGYNTTGLNGEVISTVFAIPPATNADYFTLSEITTSAVTDLSSAKARGEVTYNSGGSVRTASPFNITASSGNVRATNIDLTGVISGTGNHLDQTNVLVISDTIAIGRSRILGTESYSHYQEAGKLNFQLDFNGFIAKLGSTPVVTIDSNGYTAAALPLTAAAISGTTLTGSGLITGSAFKTTGNGTAAAPAYRFSSSTDGFYTDGTNPFWSSSGTENEVWHAGNDGAGSGLDADKVDGLQASQFLRSDTASTSTNQITATSFIVSSGGFIDNSGSLQINSSGTQAYWNNANGGALGKVSSSVKYKEDIRKIENIDLDPMNLLDAEVYQFKFKKEYLDKDDKFGREDLPGFIVEQLMNVYPKAVVLDSDGSPDSWNPMYIIPPMLSLIQDLYKKIEELEGKLNGN